MTTSSNSIRSLATLALIIATSGVLPLSLRAQQTQAPDYGNTTAATLTSVPAVTTAPGPRVQSVPFVTLVPAAASDHIGPQEVRAGSNAAMMAVGGAGLLVGLLIGGDTGILIASGGAAVGLVGLFRYLR